MFRRVVFAAVFACDAEPEDPALTPGGAGPTDPTVSDTDTDDTDDTDDVGTGGPCAVDAALSVVSAVPAAGIVPTLLEVAVALSAPATVAVQCTSDLDPLEIFLGESAVAATSHAVRLSGLLPNTTWSCTAAPTCPEQAGRATPFAWTTPGPPGDLRRLEMEIDPVLGMDGAWTLAPFTQSLFGGDTWFVVWGPDGGVRWWWPAPNGVGMWVELLWHADTGELVWGGGMHEEGRPHVIDLWAGETYAWSPPGWQQTEFHHDGKRLADGRLMTLEIRENSVGNQEWDGFGLRVHDPTTGTLDFDFDSQVLVDAGVLAPGSDFDFDPWHANWMDWIETATGPEVYVSLCLSQQILALDPLTGEANWLLGEGLGWTVLDEAGLPMTDADLPQCQHGLEVVDGVILVYDNGQGRPRSSASEWVIDAVSHTAQRTWYWTEPDWSEDYIGDIDYLPNDRILVTEATMSGDSEIVEIDHATGLVASRAVLTDGMTYRSQRYDGCALFTSARECGTIAARYDALAPLLAP